MSAGDNLNLNPPFLTMGLQTIRVFDPNTQKYSVVAEMDRGRWYPSVMTMADGNLLIIGGMQQVLQAECHMGLPPAVNWRASHGIPSPFCKCAPAQHKSLGHR